MHRPTVRTLTGTILTVAVLVAVTAGCGVSADAVLDALPASTTVATTVPDTTAPETTVPDSTTDAPTTTLDDAPTTTGGGSGSLPAEAKEVFMESCTEGADAGVCECVWDAIEDELDIETLMAAGSTETVPPALEQKIVEAMMGCMLETDS